MIKQAQNAKDEAEVRTKLEPASDEENKKQLVEEPAMSSGGQDIQQSKEDDESAMRCDSLLKKQTRKAVDLTDKSKFIEVVSSSVAKVSRRHHPAGLNQRNKE